MGGPSFSFTTRTFRIHFLNRVGCARGYSSSLTARSTIALDFGSAVGRFDPQVVITFHVCGNSFNSWKNGSI